MRLKYTFLELQCTILHRSAMRKVLAPENVVSKSAWQPGHVHCLSIELAKFILVMSTGSGNGRIQEGDPAREELLQYWCLFGNI
jgi:hypothetical protein